MADDQREYGELIATVRAQTQALTEMRASLDRLVSREEFEYKLGALEETVSRNHKHVNYKVDELTRKTDGMQEKQQELWTKTMVGSEKIFNTERVLWGLLAALSAIGTAFFKGLI